eukprot:TRINITY_DN72980_c0_g1_i1.p1 TRINITY_DN72980_c0_g1~~TRINITY_DN72980_c0_g1_i1.p1  ORF type:complete len:298 (-),score=63.13 TRINITY_DN72980_c0_g1_i1:44-937(-)
MDEDDDDDEDGESTETGTECTGSLDEFGWEPMVDEFLLELVEEAASYSPEIDWAWVSFRFLETLQPTQDQMERAVVRFSPGELCERWHYLQELGQQEERAEDFAGPLEAIDEDREVLAPEPRLESLTVESPQPPTSMENHSGVPQRRDRVLESMQSFLFGLPRPSQNPQPVRSKPCESSPCKPEQLETQEKLKAEESEELQDSLEEHDSALQESSSRAQPSQDDHPKSPKLGVAAASPNSGSGSADALRRCLEELRWHGEALQRCAAGADAGDLSREAAGRRKELLWSLGVGLNAPT